MVTRVDIGVIANNSGYNSNSGENKYYGLEPTIMVIPNSKRLQPTIVCLSQHLYNGFKYNGW